ncbi:hypothetical protein AMTR_s00017p00228030 [Amborella trichopoda]|uniref:Uncharacterized protein n=1 Tax=Amborella trichopoda TaxID=13333 RepID=W1PNH0_AMBTC|nr:hypothetical protein AMTR_s00017p00228030 [Amborella trichopoda]
MGDGVPITVEKDAYAGSVANKNHPCNCIMLLYIILASVANKNQFLMTFAWLEVGIERRFQGFVGEERRRLGLRRTRKMNGVVWFFADAFVERAVFYKYESRFLVKIQSSMAILSRVWRGINTCRDNFIKCIRVQGNDGREKGF